MTPTLTVFQNFIFFISKFLHSFRPSVLLPLKDKLVFSLLEQMPFFQKWTVVPPKTASQDDLEMYHDSDYIETLLNISDDSDDSDDDEEDKLEEYGLEDDSAPFETLSLYIRYLAGGTLTAARIIRDHIDCTDYNDFDKSASAPVAVHWYGGRHHAHKDKASGFCYINDIVLGILYLRKSVNVKRVLYLDMDVHYGDGVAEAFYTSNKVLTVSLHHYSPGFFPGTGSQSEIGSGRGLGYCVNVPVKSGVCDEQYLKLWSEISSKAIELFSPNAIVLQCGVDGLAKDPLGAFNLSSDCLTECVKSIRDAHADIPLLVLGGGGYNDVNVSKTWCSITAALCEEEVPEDVPEHDYFSKYGPDWRMKCESNSSVASTSRAMNANTDEDIDQLIQKSIEQMTKYVHARTGIGV